MKNMTMVALAVAVLVGSAQAEWKPAPGKIMTRWADDVNPEKPWPEYPRPTMVRKHWKNLNGLWDYAVIGRNAYAPSDYQGQILVPFAIESALSGVKKTVRPDQRLWYRRTFELPSDWKGQEILLHFDAVDWETTVWVNGREVGTHQGGYDPFTFDITGALRSGGEQELVVAVWDPTDRGYQPRGKQVLNPGGIWYTAVTGIWQTVWLEPVPKARIQSLRIVPDVDESLVRISVNAVGAEGLKIAAVAEGEGFRGVAEGTADKPLEIRVENPKLWSPDSPYLYDLVVKLVRNGEAVDQVSSYFGMRKIEVRKDEAGINRLFLNNEPLFQYGPLDQGWWPDGLYTPPTDEALRYDLEVLKEINCNMLRKHVKVEPARLYYWCDKLGLLVWQDMPSGDRYIGGDDPDIQRVGQSSRQFDQELLAMIDAFYNHPSIVMWVPFNEGWGQFDTQRVVNLVEEYDPTRLVNNTSGWADRGVGDVHDVHRYPGPGMPPLEPDRAAVLGEFGGLGLPVSGHTWQDEKNWGYRSYDDSEELTDAYLHLIEQLRTLVGRGLAAAVYTQTTDVEVEVNGWLTYDRAVMKMDADRLAEAHRKLYLPPPITKTIVPDARQSSVSWRYTTEKPDGDWQAVNYDDTGWKQGQAGFGSEGTPGAVVRTPWTGSDIWIRRTFDVPDRDWHNPQLAIHHDEDAQVYLNGRRVADLDAYTTEYVNVPLDREAIRVGRNVMAIHCRQTQGGQYIDAGIVDVIDQKAK